MKRGKRISVNPCRRAESALAEPLSRNEAVALGSARAPRAADDALVAGFGLGTTEWFRVPPWGIARSVRREGAPNLPPRRLRSPFPTASCRRRVDQIKAET